MPRRTIASAAIALAASLVPACAVVPPSDPHPLLQQTPAPLAQFTLQGDPVKLPESGNVTVVDLWQTSCIPCVAMMPALEQLWQRERGAGVRIVGVALDDNPGLVQAKLQERGVTYPNVVDAGGDVQRWLRVAEVPATFVFDRKGRVRWVHKGGGVDDVQTLGRMVDALVHEAGGG